MDSNILYFGDNLEVLRRHVRDESVDLVYLDPPFNSNASYNVLFDEKDGTESAAQFRAFEDSWRWDEAAARAYHGVFSEESPGRVRDAIQSFYTFLGPTDLMAYLAMMTPRLVELRRVMKPAASLYLHCDPTVSHYLKLLLDAVFRPQNFRSEIVWKRTSAHSSARRYGPVHDVILFYTRGDSWTWNPVHQPYETGYLETFLDHEDPDGRRWKRVDLTGAGVRHGETGRPWRGIDVTVRGRHWAWPPAVLDELDAKGRIHWPKTEGGMPRLKQYVEDMPGVPQQDVWTDIRPLHNRSPDRMGYPTQKPEALLQRILRSSTNEGDCVLDPFCGCGTSIIAAQRLGRRWLGIDVTHLAITLIKRRLKDTFRTGLDFRTVGEPTDLEGARTLAAQDPFQFQWWVLGLVGGRPVETKKGADRGIDGRLFFRDPPTGERYRQIVFSVKAGQTGPAHVRDLRGVLEREHADLGVLLTLSGPTGPMRTEAASAGFYHSEGWNRDYPRVQILTVEDLLAGRGVEYPPAEYVNATYRKAPRDRGKVAEPSDLFGGR